jgi:sugar lactone lactonase YvrE
MTACGPAEQSQDPLVIQVDVGSDAGSDAAEADGGTTGGLPLLGNGSHTAESVEVTTVVEATAGLDGPRDLEFNPEAEGQLWIVNRNDHSTVVVTDTGADSQSATKYNGPNSRHFMAKPAALAFGQPGRLATAQQENEATQPGTPEDFMGVSLWTSDLDVFDAGHAGHYDMLHNSPLASGIAWDEANAYWVFDGAHGAITRYDFGEDHGAGGTDHRDGVLRRYIDGQLEVSDGVVAHIAFDRDTAMVYIADTGNQRIAVLDTATGEVGGPISPNYDGSDQRYVDDAESRTLVDGTEFGLSRPAGLELHDGHLYVSDNETSTIHAFSTEGEQIDWIDLSEHIPAGGAMGLAFDEQGRLYVANAEDDTILRIAPIAQ